MERLESDTAHFAETLRQGVPGLDIHTFGSMMQYHYDRGAAAAAGGDSGKQGGEQMPEDGGEEGGVDGDEGSGAEESSDGGCHRTALEDALWDEGVFASEQCFLFLSTAIQEGGSSSGSGEIGEKGQTGETGEMGEMGKAAQGSSLVDELARKWIRAGIQARGAMTR